jgi:transcriptional regulator GlxA family with amidase domain
MSTPPTVKEIAKEAATSVRQLERKFQQIFGVGPAELSRSVRLRYGHWLVQHTKRSITGIALDCGFADGSHFTRHFRKAFNLTPREARGE